MWCSTRVIFPAALDVFSQLFSGCFHLGDVSPATCPPNFFNSTPGVSCGGLQPASTAHDAAGCAQACCGLAGCTTWQFNPRADKSTLKSHCWIGRCDKPLRNVTKEPWVGGVHS